MMFSKKKWVGWKEYQKVIREKEHVGFISNTFILSLSNMGKKNGSN